MDSFLDKITEWANQRDILTQSNPIIQYVKLQEESNELLDSLLTEDKDKIEDAIGDMLVVLQIIGEMTGTNLSKALIRAYNEIKDRYGEMRDGIFVKYDDFTLEEKYEYCKKIGKIPNHDNIDIDSISFDTFCSLYNSLPLR